MNAGFKIQYFAVFCAVLSNSAFGQFSKIIENISKRNLTLIEADIEKDKSSNTLEGIDSLSDFILSSVFEYEKGRQPNIFREFAQQSTFLRASLGISKITSWGGTFSFVQAFQDQDISEWTSSLITTFGGTEAYQFSNTLTYSQDLGKNLFGIKYRSQLKQAELGAQIATTNLQYMEESVLFQVFQAYLQAKLDKKLLQISKESLDRAEKRKNLISKRYKDGVAIRADYYRSVNAFSRAEEIHRDAKVQLDKSLQSLNELVNEDIRPSMIMSYQSYQYFNVIAPTQDYLKNKELALLNQRLILAKEVLKESETQDNFDVSLDFSFSRTGLTNQYDNAVSDAFDDDNFQTESISLNVTVPLGTSSDSYDRINKSLDVKKSEYQRSISLKNIKRNDSILRGELEKLKENLKSAQNRLNFERKILKEQNKRYNRGQIDIDQVLTAEESLLGAERTYYQYFTRVLILGLGINHLYGELKDSLVTFRE